LLKVGNSRARIVLPSGVKCITSAIDYTPELIIIEVTWVGGRSTELKKKFYQHIADEIHAKQGVRKQDIWISLVDSGREDWSFGNGEMQYAPKPE